MGLLRRPTPGEIVEGGRLGRPCGPGAHSHAIRENQFAASPPFSYFSMAAVTGTVESNSRPMSTAGGDVQVQFEACSPQRRAIIDLSAVAGCPPGRVAPSP